LHGLNVGGAEVLAAQLARRLGSTYRFLFVCLDELGTLGEGLRRDGRTVYILGRRPGIDWRCTVRLARLLHQERVDLVHAHQYTPFFYAMTARVFFRRPPVLFTEHGRHHPDYPRPKRMLVNRLLLRRRDRVIAVGQAVRQALVHNEGIPGHRADVIYNGIDLSAFEKTSLDKSAVRRQIGLDEADFVIVQVARLDYLKDHATALRAFAQVVRHRPRARLVLIGDGPERDRIIQLTHELNLTEQVRFLGLRTDVAMLLPAADLFLLTSISEGIPLTVLEAMAAGLPVVSTRVGGVAEIVEDGITGLLAASGNDAGLAAAVLRLADDRALCDQLGRSGQERARNHFSETSMHARYLRLYGEMLDV
jgi:glycosyltransferase involved in cell wall biosynthesis